MEFLLVSPGVHSRNDVRNSTQIRSEWGSFSGAPPVAKDSLVVAPALAHYLALLSDEFRCTHSSLYVPVVVEALLHDAMLYRCVWRKHRQLLLFLIERSVLSWWQELGEELMHSVSLRACRAGLTARPRRIPTVASLVGALVDIKAVVVALVVLIDPFNERSTGATNPRAHFRRFSPSGAPGKNAGRKLGPTLRDFNAGSVPVDKILSPGLAHHPLLYCDYSIRYMMLRRAYLMLLSSRKSRENTTEPAEKTSGSSPLGEAAWAESDVSFNECVEAALRFYHYYKHRTLHFLQLLEKEAEGTASKPPSCSSSDTFASLVSLQERKVQEKALAAAVERYCAVAYPPSPIHSTFSSASFATIDGDPSKEVLAAFLSGEKEHYVAVRTACSSLTVPTSSSSEGPLPQPAVEIAEWSTISSSLYMLRAQILALAFLSPRKTAAEAKAVALEGCLLHSEGLMEKILVEDSADLELSRLVSRLGPSISEDVLESLAILRLLHTNLVGVAADTILQLCSWSEKEAEGEESGATTRMSMEEIADAIPQISTASNNQASAIPFSASTSQLCLSQVRVLWSVLQTNLPRSTAFQQPIDTVSPSVSSFLSPSSSPPPVRSWLRHHSLCRSLEYEALVETHRLFYASQLSHWALSAVPEIMGEHPLYPLVFSSRLLEKVPSTLHADYFEGLSRRLWFFLKDVCPVEMVKFFLTQHYASSEESRLEGRSSMPPPSSSRSSLATGDPADQAGLKKQVRNNEEEEGVEPQLSLDVFMRDLRDLVEKLGLLIKPFCATRVAALVECLQAMKVLAIQMSQAGVTSVALFSSGTNENEGIPSRSVLPPSPHARPALLYMLISLLVQRQYGSLCLEASEVLTAFVHGNVQYIVQELVDRGIMALCLNLLLLWKEEIERVSEEAQEIEVREVSRDEEAEELVVADYRCLPLDAQRSSFYPEEAKILTRMRSVLGFLPLLHSLCLHHMTHAVVKRHTELWSVFFDVSCSPLLKLPTVVVVRGSASHSPSVNLVKDAASAWYAGCVHAYAREVDQRVASTYTALELNASRAFLSSSSSFSDQLVTQEYAVLYQHTLRNQYTGVVRCVARWGAAFLLELPKEIKELGPLIALSGYEVLQSVIFRAAAPYVPPRSVARHRPLAEAMGALWWANVVSSVVLAYRMTDITSMLSTEAAETLSFPKKIKHFLKSMDAIIRSTILDILHRFMFLGAGFTKAAPSLPPPPLESEEVRWRDCVTSEAASPLSFWPMMVQTARSVGMVKEGGLKSLPFSERIEAEMLERSEFLRIFDSLGAERISTRSPRTGPFSFPSQDSFREKSPEALLPSPLPTDLTREEGIHRALLLFSVLSGEDLTSLHIPLLLRPLLVPVALRTLAYRRSMTRSFASTGNPSHHRHPCYELVDAAPTSPFFSPWLSLVGAAVSVLLLEALIKSPWNGISTIDSIGWLFPLYAALLPIQSPLERACFLPPRLEPNALPGRLAGKMFPVSCLGDVLVRSNNLSSTTLNTDWAVIVWEHLQFLVERIVQNAVEYSPLRAANQTYTAVRASLRVKGDTMQMIPEGGVFLSSPSFWRPLTKHRGGARLEAGDGTAVLGSSHAVGSGGPTAGPSDPSKGCSSCTAAGPSSSSSRLYMSTGVFPPVFMRKLEPTDFDYIMALQYIKVALLDIVRGILRRFEVRFSNPARYGRAHYSPEQEEICLVQLLEGFTYQISPWHTAFYREGSQIRDLATRRKCILPYVDLTLLHYAHLLLRCSAPSQFTLRLRGKDRWKENEGTFDWVLRTPFTHASTDRVVRACVALGRLLFSEGAPSMPDANGVSFGCTAVSPQQVDIRGVDFTWKVEEKPCPETAELSEYMSLRVLIQLEIVITDTVATLLLLNHWVNVDADVIYASDLPLRAAVHAFPTFNALISPATVFAALLYAVLVTHQSQENGSGGDEALPLSPCSALGSSETGSSGGGDLFWLPPVQPKQILHWVFEICCDGYGCSSSLLSPNIVRWRSLEARNAGMKRLLSPALHSLVFCGGLLLQWAWWMNMGSEGAALFAQLLSFVLKSPRKYISLLEFLTIDLGQSCASEVLDNVISSKIPCLVFDTISKAVVAVRMEREEYSSLAMCEGGSGGGETIFPMPPSSLPEVHHPSFSILDFSCAVNGPFFSGSFASSSFFPLPPSVRRDELDEELRRLLRGLFQFMAILVPLPNAGESDQISFCAHHTRIKSALNKHEGLWERPQQKNRERLDSVRALGPLGRRMRAAIDPLLAHDPFSLHRHVNPTKLASIRSPIGSHTSSSGIPPPAMVADHRFPFGWGSDRCSIESTARSTVHTQDSSSSDESECWEGLTAVGSSSSHSQEDSAAALTRRSMYFRRIRFPLELPSELYRPLLDLVLTTCEELKDSYLLNSLLQSVSGPPGCEWSGGGEDASPPPPTAVESLLMLSSASPSLAFPSSLSPPFSPFFRMEPSTARPPSAEATSTVISQCPSPHALVNNGSDTQFSFLYELRSLLILLMQSYPDPVYLNERLRRVSVKIPVHGQGRNEEGAPVYNRPTLRQCIRLLLYSPFSKSFRFSREEAAQALQGEDVEWGLMALGNDFQRSQKRIYFSMRESIHHHARLGQLVQVPLQEANEMHRCWSMRFFAGKAPEHTDPLWFCPLALLLCDLAAADIDLSSPAFSLVASHYTEVRWVVTADTEPFLGVCVAPAVYFTGLTTEEDKEAISSEDIIVEEAVRALGVLRGLSISDKESYQAFDAPFFHRWPLPDDDEIFGPPSLSDGTAPANLSSLVNGGRLGEVRVRKSYAITEMERRIELVLLQFEPYCQRLPFLFLSFMGHVERPLSLASKSEPNGEKVYGLQLHLHMSEPHHEGETPKKEGSASAELRIPSYLCLPVCCAALRPHISEPNADEWVRWSGFRMSRIYDSLNVEEIASASGRLMRRGAKKHSPSAGEGRAMNGSSLETLHHVEVTATFLAFAALESLAQSITILLDSAVGGWEAANALLGSRRLPCGSNASPPLLHSSSIPTRALEWCERQKTVSADEAQSFCENVVYGCLDVLEEVCREFYRTGSDTNGRSSRSKREFSGDRSLFADLSPLSASPFEHSNYGYLMFLAALLHSGLFATARRVLCQGIRPRVRGFLWKLMGVMELLLLPSPAVPPYVFPNDCADGGKALHRGSKDSDEHVEKEVGEPLSMDAAPCYGLGAAPASFALTVGWLVRRIEWIEVVLAPRIRFRGGRAGSSRRAGEEEEEEPTLGEGLSSCPGFFNFQNLSEYFVLRGEERDTCPGQGERGSLAFFALMHYVARRTSKHALFSDGSYDRYGNSLTDEATMELVVLYYALVARYTRARVRLACRPLPISESQEEKVPSGSEGPPPSAPSTSHPDSFPLSPAQPDSPDTVGAAPTRPSAWASFDMNVLPHLPLHYILHIVRSILYNIQVEETLYSLEELRGGEENPRRSQLFTRIDRNFLRHFSPDIQEEIVYMENAERLETPAPVSESFRNLGLFFWDSREGGLDRRGVRESIGRRGKAVGRRRQPSSVSDTEEEATMKPLRLNLEGLVPSRFPRTSPKGCIWSSLFASHASLSILRPAILDLQKRMYSLDACKERRPNRREQHVEVGEGTGFELNGVLQHLNLQRETRGGSGKGHHKESPAVLSLPRADRLIWRSWLLLPLEKSNALPRWACEKRVVSFLVHSSWRDYRILPAAVSELLDISESMLGIPRHKTALEEAPEVPCGEASEATFALFHLWKRIFVSSRAGLVFLRFPVTYSSAPGSPPTPSATAPLTALERSIVEQQLVFRMLRIFEKGALLSSAIHAIVLSCIQHLATISVRLMGAFDASFFHSAANASSVRPVSFSSSFWGLDAGRREGGLDGRAGEGGEPSQERVYQRHPRHPLPLTLENVSFPPLPSFDHSRQYRAHDLPEILPPCSACGVQDQSFWRCSFCSAALCRDCLDEPLTKEDQTALLRRYSFYLCTDRDVLELLFASNVHNPRLHGLFASYFAHIQVLLGLDECNKLSPAGLGMGLVNAVGGTLTRRESNHLNMFAAASGEDGERKSGEKMSLAALNYAEQQIIKASLDCACEIQGLCQRFQKYVRQARQRCEAREGGSPGGHKLFTASEAFSLVRSLEFRSRHAPALQFFEVYGWLCRPSPRELAVLFHALEEYLSTVGELVEQLPLLDLTGPLPNSVTWAFLMFCWYHLEDYYASTGENGGDAMACRGSLTGDSLSCSTVRSPDTRAGETERFLRDHVTHTSKLSQAAWETTNTNPPSPPLRHTSKSYGFLGPIPRSQQGRGSSSRIVPDLASSNASLGSGSPGSPGRIEFGTSPVPVPQLESAEREGGTVSEFGTPLIVWRICGFFCKGSEGEELQKKIFRGKLPHVVKRFLREHRSLLNALLKQDQQLLSGPLWFVRLDPSLLDFYLTEKMLHERLAQLRGVSTTRLEIQRSNFLQSSVDELQRADLTRGAIFVKFVDEEGVDAGGIIKEWFQLFCAAILDEKNDFFVVSKGSHTFHPNPLPEVNPLRLQYFYLTGIVTGLAIAHRIPIDLHFTRAIYRHIRGEEPILSDLEMIDPELYNNLRWVAKTEGSAESLSMMFTVTYERGGKTEEAELIEGGRSIEVTEENKQQYVRLLAQFMMTERMRPELAELLKGLYRIIPRPLLQMFTYSELELLICGSPEVNVEDLRQATLYEGYSSSSPQIRWFWEVVASMTSEDRGNLLQFITGTSRVPHGGFTAMRAESDRRGLVIALSHQSPDSLPQAHTCFNKLDLPLYRSFEELHDRLKLAITFGNQGFGFA